MVVARALSLTIAAQRRYCAVLAGGEILEEHKFVIRDCFALAKRKAYKHYISGLTARLLRIARQLMGL